MTLYSSSAGSVSQHPPFHIHRFAELTSTSLVAREWARQHAPDGTVLVADRQTAGRGRQGRSWTSLPGALLFSVLLRPHWEPTSLPRLGFYACVAAARAAEAMGAPRAWLKWPNDLVLPNPSAQLSGSPRTPPLSWLKWGGVLVETGQDEGGWWAVVGVGLNVGHSENLEGDDFSFTSLSAALPQSTQPDTMLHAFLDAFDPLYRIRRGGDWSRTLMEWRARDVLSGQPVRAEQQGRWIEGIARSITSSGALIIRTASGELELQAGDVHLDRMGR